MPALQCCWECHSAMFCNSSQRRYVGSNLIKDLVSNFNSLNTEKYDVQTFIGSDFKQFKQVYLGLRFDQGNNHTLPFLVDNNLKLQYNINNLTSANKNLKSQNITLADSYFYSKNNHDRFELEMLI